MQLSSPPLQALKIYIFGLPDKEGHFCGEKIGQISSITLIIFSSTPHITLSAVPCESTASTIQSTLARIRSFAKALQSLKISYKEYATFI